MTVALLFAAVPGARVPSSLAPLEVRGLRLDSREVAAGDLFFALSGQKRDGGAFARAALASGALAVVASEEAARSFDGLPVIAVPEARQAIALCAAELNGHPDRSLELVGVTGTNGKTTSALLTAAALGGDAGYLGTIGYRVAGSWRRAPFTTPEAPELTALLASMVASGTRACAMEVSSHALAQDRVLGLQFSAAGFTNLTRDHLDFHGDMERYYGAKRRLFLERLRPGGLAVVNGDDSWGRRLHGELVAAGRPVWRFGQGADAEVRLLRAQTRLDGTQLDLRTPSGELALRSPLVGAHNAQNLSLAAGLALALGRSPEAVAQGLGSVERVPGRLERVGRGRPLAFVDYAHTDDALTRVCAALRELGAGRLILVVGCGGDRDRGKRPLMGEAAARGAELVIATSDNPRSERPEAILADLVSGLTRAGAQPLSRAEASAARGFLIESDRAAAIRLAVSLARPEDVVLVAGKGHEDYQIIGGQTLHFDDREELAAALGEGS
ncbi:MAG: UDP-N-acetylmuramoyl-L-alanyl-D-glutamate--2,6-diaminopimelate ligase [Deltaproteobacteria bacterium]